MNTLAKTLSALALAAVALPTVAVAQGLTLPSTGTTLSRAIADLDGRIQAVTPAQADSFGLPALPAGQAYGIKDSRIVVLDDIGAVVDIVRVVSSSATTS